MLGAIAVGAFSDVAAAVRAMARTRAVVEPRKEHGNLYDALFALYKDVYESAASAGVYRRMYSFQSATF